MVSKYIKFGLEIFGILIVYWCTLHVVDGDSTISIAQNCTLDMALVIDRSGSVYDASIEAGRDYWQDILNFASSIGDVLQVSLPGTRLAAVTFGHRGTLEFDLDDYGNPSEIRQALNRMDTVYSATREHTNTSGGFAVARTQVFTPAGGDRPGVKNIIVLLTDGKATLDVDQLPVEVQRLKDDGVIIFAVGVTNQIDEQSLKQIVSSPVNDHFILIANFTSLINVVNQVVAPFCDVIKVIVPVTEPSDVTGYIDTPPEPKCENNFLNGGFAVIVKLNERVAALEAKLKTMAKSCCKK